MFKSKYISIISNLKLLPEKELNEKYKILKEMISNTEVMGFRVGDRIKVINENGFCSNTHLIDAIGTIVTLHGGNSVSVDFDQEFDRGHDCDGEARQGHGYNGYTEEIALLEPRKPEKEKITKKDKLNILFSGSIYNLKAENETKKRDLKYQIERLNSDIKSYKKGIKTHKILVEENKKQLAQWTETNLQENANRIVTQLQKINTHPQVEKAYITKDYNQIIVITKMLYPTWNTEYEIAPELLKKSLGKFCLIFSLFPSSRISKHITINNLSFTYGRYRHPNILEDGRVCFGGDGNIYYIDLLHGNYYSLLDSLILFISLFPQDSGASPYCDYFEWLRHRRKIPNNKKIKLAEGI